MSPLAMAPDIFVPFRWRMDDNEASHKLAALIADGVAVKQQDAFGAHVVPNSSTSLERCAKRSNAMFPISEDNVTLLLLTSSPVWDVYRHK